jgi:hypothetical protein
VDNIGSLLYMGPLLMKTKLNPNIGCVMSLKWSQVGLYVAKLTFHSQITSWSTPHNHMPPPKLSKLLPPYLSTKIKRVIFPLVELLIMEEDGCSLIFSKVSNPNFMKVVGKITMFYSPNK